MQLNNLNSSNRAQSLSQVATSSAVSQLFRQGGSSRRSYSQPQHQPRYQQQNFFQMLLQLILQLIKQLQGGHQSGNKYRTQDGTNNNRRHPELGSANEPFRQLIPKDKDREIGGVTEAQLPSARDVSNTVADQKVDTENKKGLSDMFWLWGQFLDHDINLTHTDHSNPAPIKVPTGDQYFDPDGTGDQTIGFDRSTTPAAGRYASNSGEKTQENDITAYIDGSNVYGSSDEEADKLRSHEGGRLIEGVDGLLPTDDKGSFLAGDIRVNEHAGLTSMHTIWMREHNRVADGLSEKHPRWSDERVFQESRKQVIAQMQAITYNEFVPQLLGKDKLGDYKGYDSRLDPQISNSFATAAYRLGHTMLSPTIQRLDEQGNEIEEGHLALRDAFFKPEHVKEAGIDPILRGFAAQTAQAVDPMLVDDVRNFLFGKPGQGGFDLAALNTQRGRDHGLASLNDSREALGLERITSFDDPAWEGDFGQKLAQVYDSPDDVDLWIGGLAEKKDGDSLVGSTFTEILSDQFKRLRSADSFWYEKKFSQRAINRFDNTTLADVIKRNTGIQSLQDNVLVAKPRGSSEAQPSIATFAAADTVKGATGADGAAGAIGATGATGISANADEAAPAPTVRAFTLPSVQPLSVDEALPEEDSKTDPLQEQRIRDAIEKGLFG